MLRQSQFNERNGLVSPDGRWLAYGSNGDGQAADECEWDVGSSKVRVDLSQRGLERRHPSLALISTSRPTQSPDSAPGRS